MAQARATGATDLEIHDTVLIAAAFCMMNRYVDGLATTAPEDPALYAAGGPYSSSSSSARAACVAAPSRSPALTSV